MAFIDTDLYDRQLRTYGLEAISKLSSSSILIYGLAKGLATEISKNLVLGGIKELYLFDNNPILEEDLDTGFYYSINDIGKPRNIILKNKLEELNPYSQIFITDIFTLTQNITILINQPLDIIKQVSTFTRNNNSKLIVLFSKCISGLIFVDALENHLITDLTGEIIEPVQISNITPNGIVSTAPNTNHDFQTGDYIIFDNLQGTNIEQFKQEFKINVINRTTFSLDKKLNDFTFINGTAIHQKKPIYISHKSFQDSLNSTLDNISIKIFNSYLGIEHSDIPNYELMPVVSIMGSLVASEAIKLITNKYYPINQWFAWTDINLEPKEIYPNAKTTLGKLYGLELENKLINSKWLIVGSGAIGCELLKNLAFMNIANPTLGNGQLIITDPDHIEKSNLNRQFLFRYSHIGKAKSIIAADSIKQMKNINIIPYTEKVSRQNILFTDNILPNITGVLNALDNIEARRFMDEQIFKYNIPLFESGTTGTKGNTQPIIPFITETYSASTDPEQEKTYPLCTIKSFPNQIHHTIQWALEQFNFFTRIPNTLNQWINNPDYLNKISSNEKTLIEHDINLLTIKYPIQKGIDECIKLAIDLFNQNYYYNINDLLKAFDPNYIIDGKPFWAGGKRCPKPILFDINNELHFTYLELTTKLLLIMAGLEENQLPKNIKNYTYHLSKLELDTTLGNPNDFLPIFQSLEFDKDNDLYIEWITVVSNIRAMNYDIKIADRLETKGIAGRIIPAIATTTSIVSGLISLELIKYLLDYKLNNYYSSFVNLAEPIIIQSEPIKAPTIKIGELEFNNWLKFEYNKNTTLKEFKEYYENIFKTNINMIVLDTIPIYSDLFGDYELDKYLLDIVKTYFDYSKNISITLMGNIEDLPIITLSL